jgi:PepSY-associated TM region
MSIFKRAFWARQSRSLHLLLGWVGGLALLAWGLSGITHPVMSWTGPEQARFFPPRLEARLDAAQPPAAILARHGITQALHVRVVPSIDGAALQVTAQEKAPRRYFSLQTGDELAGRDKDHAIWLARYYTGLKDAPVAGVTFQTEFDNDYPWVNRLLPVWRVEFATPDARRAYLYTETNALGAQHNANRFMLQGVFQALHNWHWLQSLPAAKFILMGLFMLALLGMALSGIAMVLSFRARTIEDGRRRWHRRFAYLIWLPVLAFTASGTYRLLQEQLGEHTRGLKPGAALDLSALKAMPPEAWQQLAASGAANSFSLIEGPRGLLIRVERPAPQAPAAPATMPGPHDHHGGESVTRPQRFAGRPSRGEIVYFEAATGRKADLSEEDMAKNLAIQLGGAKPGEITRIEKIERFGMGYDFRNKRLPVWQVELADQKKRHLFIDPGANLIVDQSTRMERAETWSFSMLHKWNFLRAYGPWVMDGAIVTSILAACIAALFGFAMLIRQRRARQPGPAGEITPAPAE